jgi:hypothetical protein
MPKFQVAHILEQGVNLIIIPLDSSFGHKSSDEQGQIISELQMRASSANLAGTVVPVWNAGAGRMAFIAPSKWHPFFRTITLQWVAANINKALSW